MLSPDTVQLVMDQVVEVQTEHPSLELILDSGKMFVKGALRFNYEFEGRLYNNYYQVKINISPDYPASVPTAEETVGVIPPTFHQSKPSSTTKILCLAAPVELYRVFARKRTLLHFINMLLVPYLFYYTYFQEHSQMPYGELQHGSKGLREYYRDLFAVDVVSSMKLVKLLADDITPSLKKCPCKSGRNLQDCHGPKLDELRPLLPSKHFDTELREIIRVTLSENFSLPLREVMPKRMFRNWKKQRRKESRTR